MRAPLSSWAINVKVIELQKSLVDRWIFFRPFLKTLTADDKYSLISRGNWMQTIQMHVSKKPKIFLFFFCSFRICIKFKTFPKKDDPHPLINSEITDNERRA